MTTPLCHDQIQALIAEHFQDEQTRLGSLPRRRGRPPVPHREWLRAEISQDLLELLRKEASDRNITVTALMSVVLCERYGVQLTADNQIAAETAGSA